MRDPQSVNNKARAITGVRDMRLDLDALSPEAVAEIAEQLARQRAAMKVKRAEILVTRNDRPSILGVEMVSATVEAEREEQRNIARGKMR